MFSAVSSLRFLSRIIPFEEFKLLCTETSTGKLKNCVIFKRLSVWAFRVVSTKSVLFFNFLTDLGVPIDDCICFSITNGDNDVIGFSLFFDSITMNLGKLSTVLNSVAASISSSESGLSRLRFEEAIFSVLSLDGYALHPPWSPTRGRYTETALQFPAPKLHTRHTRRARFQSTSDYPSFNNN